MTTLITGDALSDLDDGWGTDRANADTLVSWVTDPEYVLDEDVDALDVLRSAAEAFTHLDLQQDAEEVADLAEQLPGERAHLVALTIRMGVAASQEDLDRVREIADDLRHRRPQDLDTYLWTGELLEECGELVRAERWFTIGVRLAEDWGAGDGQLLMLHNGRWRVRRTLGKPYDVTDERQEKLHARLMDSMGLEGGAS